MRRSVNLPLFSALLTGAVLLAPAAQAGPTYEILPNQKKQTVLGFGVELQSDSIGSGNHGLPDAAIGIPHDLTPPERERLAREMLKGFRYLRLAGGLYWRGLDASGKQFEPRWPEQLSELKTLVDRAGIEGLSFEYWSPPPFWKANRSLVGQGPTDPRNTLRPFAPGFAEDPDYRGDRNRFFGDFAHSIIGDIDTLRKAGLRVSMFGMQNEPWVSNNTYSANRYASSADYLAAFMPVATAVRAYDPKITILADTGEGFPSFIGPGMRDPKVAALVDAYAVHTIGRDSTTVVTVDAKIRTELPTKPWFQNEYEYLTGGATPARTLNIVQHIINSFEIAGNPTWFWLHALKPAGNAEASGYALGFWNSRIAPIAPTESGAWLRWSGGPPLTNLPPDLRAMEMVYSRGGDSTRPGPSFTFNIDRPARVLLLVEEHGGFVPEGWTDTGRTLKRGDKLDRIYSRVFQAGSVHIPAHSGRENGGYGPPNAAFVQAIGARPVSIEIGINTPAYVRSQTIALEKRTRGLAPGSWVFNPLNWNAVGSFVNRMPWNSVVLAVKTSR
ncbi:MAG: hypothetical protein ACTHJR_14300 [Sphingomonas sp.]|uniref:hypothetical protein n=1 Tax=Sphingomonas sp. TaxID=28214 RepID=UPI003F8128EF